MALNSEDVSWKSQGILEQLGYHLQHKRQCVTFHMNHVFYLKDGERGMHKEAGKRAQTEQTSARRINSYCLFYLLFSSEDGGSLFFQNVGGLLTTQCYIPTGSNFSLQWFYVMNEAHVKTCFHKKCVHITDQKHAIYRTKQINRTIRFLV